MLTLKDIRNVGRMMEQTGGVRGEVKLTPRLQVSVRVLLAQ